MGISWGGESVSGSVGGVGWVDRFVRVSVIKGMVRWGYEIVFGVERESS